jgi:HPt (histidine-containing phosphotransfer) domain-containing protein
VVPSSLLEKIRVLDKSLEQETINLNYLKNITDNNTALMIDLIDTFIDTIPGQIEQMKSLAAKKDWTSLYLTVHKAKPGFQYMGIKKLYTLTSQLEENVQAGLQQETYESNIQQMEAITRHVVQELHLLKMELHQT